MINKDILKDSKKNYFSTTELAALLGVSRISIFKSIKSGKIHAEKIGKNYIIPKSEYEAILGIFVSDRQKRTIERTVDKVVKEYGDALRKLGQE